MGFGGALFEPLTLAEGSREDVPYAVSLEPLAGGHWRFTERHENPFGYDFRAPPDRYPKCARPLPSSTVCPAACSTS